MTEKCHLMSRPETIEIPNEDYGIWYLDARDHADTYNGKKVSFTGMVLKSREFAKNEFVPGRMAMTCCADDTTFLGFVCKSDEARHLKTGKWVNVVAKVKYEFVPAYGETGPVLYAISVEETEPLKDELVYFS